MSARSIVRGQWPMARVTWLPVHELGKMVE